MAGVMPMHADEDKPTVHLNLQTRASYVNDRIGSEVQHDASGMKATICFSAFTATSTTACLTTGASE